MKAIFVHDHPFTKKNNLVYTDGGLPAKVWGRYLAIFPSLTVVGRVSDKAVEVAGGETLSSCPGVDFELFPSISSLRQKVALKKSIYDRIVSLVATHDVVIARLYSHLGLAFIKVARRMGKPYAIEIVGCPWDAHWHYGGWMAKMFAPVSFMELRRESRISKFSLYVTTSFLQKRYPSPRGVAVSCSNVEIPPVRSEVLEKRCDKVDATSKGGKKLVIGLIGNYSSSYKGIDVAIKSLAVVDKCIHNYELQIVGSGNAETYQQLARKLGVSEKVIFLGRLSSGEKVFSWLESVDIYLQPSLTEGLPRALIEALSVGCPALGSNVGGIPELLPSECLINKGDYVTLGQRILELSLDPTALQRAAIRNFSLAKRYYKPILDAKRYEFLSTFASYAEEFKGSR